MPNHLLCLSTAELRPGGLALEDDADFRREVHWMLSVAAVDEWEFRVLQTSIICYLQLAQFFNNGGNCCTCSEKVKDAYVLS